MRYETLFPQILNMSITGSLVIVLVLIARLLFKKAPGILSYSLWVVVLFRLLCPVTLSANFSALNLFDVPVTEEYTIEYVPNDIVSNAFPKVDLLVDTASDAVNRTLPQGQEQVEQMPLANIMTSATAVWLLGGAVLLIHSLHALYQLRKKLGDAVHLRENIYVSHRLDTPIVMGLIRPRIYLPDGLSRVEQDHVLLHEDYHIRRGDHVVKLLSFAALCIHWFNPIVWLAFYLADKDMEMSCDEAVVKDMTKEIRCDYSESLLRLSTGRRVVSAGPLSFCEGDPKGRIKNILSWKNPRFLTWVAGTTSCAMLAVSLLTDPVFAVETEQAFQKRIHLNLPEGYDYLLLDDPNYPGTDKNIIIVLSSSEYPVCEGCISLEFSAGDCTPWGSYPLQLDNGIVAWPYPETASGWSSIRFEFPDGGYVDGRVHNSSRWTDEDYGVMLEILGGISVTGTDAYQLVDLSTEPYLSAKASDLPSYSLWTDNGTIHFDFSDASGEVTVSLYETYSDRLVASFHTADAAREDHGTFTGLTKLKEYYIVVTGADGAMTVFN